MNSVVVFDRVELTTFNNITWTKWIGKKLGGNVFRDPFVSTFRSSSTLIVLSMYTIGFLREFVLPRYYLHLILNVTFMFPTLPDLWVSSHEFSLFQLDLKFFHTSSNGSSLSLFKRGLTTFSNGRHVTMSVLCRTVQCPLRSVVCYLTLRYFYLITISTWSLQPSSDLKPGLEHRSGKIGKVSMICTFYFCVARVTRRCVDRSVPVGTV